MASGRWTTMVDDAPVTRATLLSRLSGGDAQVWSEFERTYRGLVQRFCRRLGLTSAETEDAWQLVLIGLSSAIASFHYDPERGRFRSYLFRAVRSAVARCRRGASTQPTPIEDVDAGALETEDGSLRELWEQEWIDHHYRLAHATLRRSFDARSVALFEELLAGRSVAEVAEQRAMTQDAVHKVKQRVRQCLSEIVAQQIAREDGGER
jgi:RNA polymerase sigma-70 factor (ECF subfamily)